MKFKQFPQKLIHYLSKEITIRDRIAETLGNFPNDLKDINCLYKITKLFYTYIEKSIISKSEVIDACLAVDAICFTPDVKITNHSEVYGLELKEELYVIGGIILLKISSKITSIFLFLK